VRDSERMSVWIRRIVRPRATRKGDVLVLVNRIRHSSRATSRGGKQTSLLAQMRRAGEQKLNRPPRLCENANSRDWT